MNSGISPRPGLRVETLAVASLALLQRRGDVDQEERAAGRVDHLAHLRRGSRRTARSGCRRRARRGGRSRRPPSRSGGCWSRGPRGRTSGRRRGGGVRRRRRGWSRCARPCSSTRSMSARASVDLPLPDSPVKNSTRPWSAGAGWSAVDDRRRSRRRSRRSRVGVSRRDPSVSAWTGSSPAYVVDDPHPERVVGLGVVVGGERHRDHRGRRAGRRRAGWPGRSRRGRARACRCRRGRAARPRRRPRPARRAGPR